MPAIEHTTIASIESLRANSNRHDAEIQYLREVVGELRKEVEKLTQKPIQREPTGWL